METKSKYIACMNSFSHTSHIRLTGSSLLTLGRASKYYSSHQTQLYQPLTEVQHIYINKTKVKGQCNKDYVAHLQKT